MGTKQRVAIALLVVISFCLVVAAAIGMIALGTVVAVDRDVTDRGSTRLSLGIVIFGTVIMCSLLIAMLQIVIEDYMRRRAISPLYWPMLATKGTLTLYMLVLSAQSVDYLSHDLVPHWRQLQTPFLRIEQNMVLLAVFCSFAWLLLVILKGRDFSPRRAFIVCFSIGIFVAAIASGVAASGGIL